LDMEREKRFFNSICQDTFKALVFSFRLTIIVTYAGRMAIFASLQKGPVRGQ